MVIRKMKPNGYYSGYKRSGIRTKDKTYLRWLKGAIIHHDWLPESNIFLRRALVDKNIHAYIHYGKIRI